MEGNTSAEPVLIQHPYFTENAVWKSSSPLDLSIWAHTWTHFTYTGLVSDFGAYRKKEEERTAPSEDSDVPFHALVAGGLMKRRRKAEEERLERARQEIGGDEDLLAEAQRSIELDFTAEQHRAAVERQEQSDRQDIAALMKNRRKQ